MPVTELDIKVRTPFRIRLDLDPTLPNEDRVLTHLRGGFYYEADVAHALLHTLTPGDVAVDVGANIGLFTLLMAGLVGPQGHVFSFEPGVNNLPRLTRNMELSAFGNIELTAAAVGAQTGEVEFFINEADGGGNAVWDPASYDSSGHTPSRRVAVPQVALDEIFANRPAPKLVKIDTEGAELNVLRGAQKLLSARKIPYIVAELNAFGLAKLGQSADDLRQYMAMFGYDMFALYTRGNLPKLIPLGVDLGTPFIPNVLFSTPENVARAWPSEWFDRDISPDPQAG